MAVMTNSTVVTPARSTTELSVTEAIKSRVSIRKYVQEPMNQDDLREILELASLAPSAWNAQTWRFAVVQTPEIKEKLQAASYGQSQIGNAPAVIVVYSDMEDTLATVEETAHPGMGDEGRAKQRQTFEGAFGQQDVALATLTEQERLIVKMYYFEHLLLKEIAAVLGLTESRICQIHGRIMGVLRARIAQYV